MKLYLAGPMTGLPDWNIPAFLRVGAELRAAGHEVSIPCETDEPQEGRSWEWWMDRDIRTALDCEGVAVLPGWEESRGASLEVFLMATLGRPVFRADTLERIEVCPCHPLDLLQALEV